MARVLPSRADIRDPGNEFHACSSESAGGWGRRSRVFVVTAPSAGRCWAATTTEGLLIYSLDARMLFDPFELDTSVTPARVRAALRQRDFTRAILMAFRLNERKLLQEALESVPWDEGEPRARGGGGGGAGPQQVPAGLASSSQSRSSAPPCRTCTWRRCWSFWLRPWRCRTIWSSTSCGRRSCSWRTGRSSRPGARASRALGRLLWVQTRRQGGLWGAARAKGRLLQGGDAAAGGSVPPEEHPAPLRRPLQAVCRDGRQAGGLSPSRTVPRQGCGCVIGFGDQGPGVGVPVAPLPGCLGLDAACKAPSVRPPGSGQQGRGTLQPPSSATRDLPGQGAFCLGP